MATSSCSVPWAGSSPGLLVVPVAYGQYCLMPLSIACLFAAQGLLFLVELAPKSAPVAGSSSARSCPCWCCRCVYLGWSFGQRNDRQMARLRYVFDAHRAGRSGAGRLAGDRRCFVRIRSTTSSCTASCWRAFESDKDAYLGPLESGRCARRSSRSTTSCWRWARVSRSFLRSHYTSSDGLFYFPIATQPTRTGENPLAR